MSGLDITIVIAVIIITIAMFLGTKIIIADSYVKLSIYFFVIGFCIYSGIGIAYSTVDNYYILQYGLFLFLFIIGAYFSTRIINSMPVKKHKIIFDDGLIKLVAVFFWALMFIKLVYPVNHIPNLFNPTITVVDIFERKESVTVFTYIVDRLLLVIRPIYYIYLYKKCSVRKTAFLMALEVYVGIAINGYIARSGFISQVIFIILSVISKSGRKDEKNISIEKREEKEKRTILKKYRKAIIIIGLMFVISMPLLFEYQYYRLGYSSGSSLSTIDKIDSLLSVEFSFPSWFGNCERIYNWKNGIEYLKWFVTLIIPKRLFGNTDVILINNILSTDITGIVYGDSSFNMYLPGILGEGIIIYGRWLACIHGLFLGFVSSLIIGICSRYKEMRIWVLYLVVNVLLMCRGGSQGTISLFINGSILIFILSFLDKYRIKIKL